MSIIHNIECRWSPWRVHKSKCKVEDWVLVWIWIGSRLLSVGWGIALVGVALGMRGIGVPTLFRWIHYKTKPELMKWTSIKVTRMGFCGIRNLRWRMEMRKHDIFYRRWSHAYTATGMRLAEFAQKKGKI